jgi:acetyl-CoA synthetase
MFPAEALSLLTMRIRSLEDRDQQLQAIQEDPTKFWLDMAETNFQWKSLPSKALEGSLAEANVRWFADGTLNITKNCLDRHVTVNPERTAFLWEPNNPQDAMRTISYAELAGEVDRLCWMLHKLGVRKGDRVCIYMPMVPEAVFAMLACARMGAVHSVVFAGFSAQSLADRLNDSGAALLITADSFFRGDKEVRLKNIADEALRTAANVAHCLVYRHTHAEVSWHPERDRDWRDLLNQQALEPFPAAEMAAEDPLFILYTSGSTGQPKGLMHTTAGYMVWAAYTFQNVFQYEPEQLFWCTADIGWITGHTYGVYGPLLSGATFLLFEGIPTSPTPSRFWEVIDKHRVNVFYTAPTAIRSLIQFGDAPLETRSLASLKVLGTVGEPINEEAWHWYDEKIGRGNCPIVDTWWQTETGGIMISNLAGITTAIPTHATLPLPGVDAVLLDEAGHILNELEAEGKLCISAPWPGMARTIYGNHERFKEVYLSAFSGFYFTGDGAKRDTDGNYRITGRVDDIIIVSGHNLGTAEIENAINEHPEVTESAVVGFPHPIKGHAVMAYVITLEPIEEGRKAELQAEINALVVKLIGALARPDKIQFVPGLPRTRSGKIMRRILRKIAEGERENFGDISTLVDPSIVEKLLNA